MSSVCRKQRKINFGKLLVKMLAIKAEMPLWGMEIKMDANLYAVTKQRMARTAAALEKANFTPYCVDTAQQALALIETLVPAGAVVACGGSMSLEQAGVMQLLRSGKYRLMDRARKDITPEEIGALYRDVFSADCYFSSVNALTEDGALVNMDGNSNRVAALAFGPKEVILLVGANKIVDSLAAAERRIAEVAAPANAKRLSCKTPCAETGVCVHCHSPACICCTMTVMRHSRTAGRVKVILVAESLGY